MKFEVGVSYILSREKNAPPSDSDLCYYFTSNKAPRICFDISFIQQTAFTVQYRSPHTFETLPSAIHYISHSDSLGSDGVS